MNNYYCTITEVFDFGPHIRKVILDMGISLKNLHIEKDTFKVFVKRISTQGEDFVWPEFMGIKLDFPMEGTREITNFYPSDKKGFPKEDGTFLTLELKCDPRDNLGSIIRFDGEHNVFVNCHYTITQEKSFTSDSQTIENLVFDQDGGNQIIYGEWLKEGYFEHPQTPLSYVFYSPEASANEKFPLLIWLHGAGEGGNDTPIAAIGNKVVNLISPEIQTIFGKAHLLAPQSPTMWMDDGSGQYTTSGHSVYTEALEALIEDFIKSTPSVDPSRIYIGGCSNGGFMTMRMLLRNPKRYAGAFPVCEAMFDKALSAKDIETLSSIPIWFVHAKNDPVVSPSDYVVATYERLLAAGANNLHFTFFDKIIDATGNYKDENGNPYEYSGHWAWIPMLNNQCSTDFDGSPVLLNGSPATILEWLAAQKKFS